MFTKPSNLIYEKDIKNQFKKIPESYYDIKPYIPNLSIYKPCYNYLMSPRHFSKTMFNPYFQSEHYKNESPELKIQRTLESKLKWFVTIPIRVLRSLFKFPPRNK